MSVFHSHDGWHWERIEDGSVKIHAISSAVDGHRSVHHVVSADVWASIVASVSAGGEVNGRFYEAQAFHAGRPSPATEEWKRATPTIRNAALEAERDALKAEVERLRDEACSCATLVEQFIKHGRTLESSCLAHEFRVVDGVAGLRSERDARAAEAASWKQRQADTQIHLDAITIRWREVFEMKADEAAASTIASLKQWKDDLAGEVERLKTERDGIAAECAAICEAEAERLAATDDRGEIWKDGKAMALGARHCAIYVRGHTGPYEFLKRLEVAVRGQEAAVADRDRAREENRLLREIDTDRVKAMEVARDAYNAARRCLGFFASVIKSGEPWTADCQREYDAALGPKDEG